MKLIWVGRIISYATMGLFVMSGVMKLMNGPQVAQGMGHLGLPESLIKPLGILELACVLVYVIPQTATLGAILFAGYMGGAMLAHLRIGEPVYMHIVLGVAIWLGLYLREGRLREILPIRKGV